jgi:hypothetical protein
VTVKRKVKREAPASLLHGRLELRRPKEEDVQPPPPKKCWEMELEAQAAYRGPDDLEDALGQHLLVGRFVDEDYRHVTYSAREAELWSDRDSGNFVDLVATEPSPSPAPKEEEDDWDFDFSDDDDVHDGLES